MNSFTTTENKDAAFTTSGNYCLDFFTRITRNAPVNDYIDAFTKAWNENKETAYQVLMNLRDVRNGKGEKLIPAVVMVYLRYNIDSNVYESMLRKMIEYGYWKDLLRIIEINSRTELEYNKKSVPNFHTCPIEIQLFAEQLKKDSDALEVESDKKIPISLCAKWAPSEKTHYDHHPMCAARNIATAMKLNLKEYRLMITKLRKHLGILEMLMSTQQYDLIDFSKLPSVALMKLKKAFNRDTNSEGVESEARKKLKLSYKDFLEKLSKGKVKVNVKGIQPHELVSTYMEKGDLDPLVEGQWNEIKKQVRETGAFRNVTAVVDVSGSMQGQPMLVAIALGILVAECTTGPFHGKMITFHERPTWHRLVGSSLKDQVHCVSKAPWGGSTDIRAVFDVILQEAVNADLTQDEMVKTLFIFTDMQFNSACGLHSSWGSSFEYAKRKFSDRGYQLPHIICWNLRTSSSKSLPVLKNQEGYAMLSGFSAELLKCILNAQEFSPYSMMMHILEPYNVPPEVTQSQISALTPPFGNIKYLEQAVEKSAIKQAYKGMKNKPKNDSSTDDDSDDSDDSNDSGDADKSNGSSNFSLSEDTCGNQNDNVLDYQWDAQAN
jgi:hypothetical protein